jgi:molecular chaperone DnaK
VLQGERKLARDNRTLGRFQLTGIPPAPRGMPKIEVTFDIDANGILHVSAKDQATAKEQKIRIEGSSGLSESEVDRMVKEAEQHAAEDQEKRDEIDRRNRLDAMVYQVERDSKEWVERLDTTNKERLNKAVADAKEALRTGSPDGIRTALDELTQAFSAAGASLYEQTQASSTEGAGGGQQRPPADETKPDDVVDADYEVVDENKPQ